MVTLFSLFFNVFDIDGGIDNCVINYISIKVEKKKKSDVNFLFPLKRGTIKYFILHQKNT